MFDDALSRAERVAAPGLDYEAELVRAAKERDEEAWAAIYRQHHPKVYRYMLARVADRDTAEDLAAAVFVEALKGIGSYSARGRPLLAWLYGIARNLANYHHRSSFRKKAGTERGAAGRDAVIDANADPAMLIDGWDLRHAVSALSGDQREVVLLRFFVGLTTPETAAVLGKKEGAVYSLQARAVQALRKRLA